MLHLSRNDRSELVHVRHDVEHIERGNHGRNRDIARAVGFTMRWNVDVERAKRHDIRVIGAQIGRGAQIEAAEVGLS